LIREQSGASPPPSANGSATVSFAAQDNGNRRLAQPQEAFVINTPPVNDVRVYQGANQIVNETRALSPSPGWAKPPIGKGQANESRSNSWFRGFKQHQQFILRAAAVNSAGVLTHHTPALM